MKSLVRALCFATAVIGAANTALAATITYIGQSAFNAAVTEQVEQNFDLLNGFYSSGLDVSGMTGYTFSANATGGIFADSSLGVISTNNPVDLTFTFTGVLPTAVGGLFFMTDSSFNAVSSGVKISLSDGTVIILSAPTGDALNTIGAFLGFTSDLGISSLTVGGSILATPGFNVYPTINSLYFNSVSEVPEVPVPGTLGLLGLGLAGLGAVRRRKA